LHWPRNVPFKVDAQPIAWRDRKAIGATELPALVLNDTFGRGSPKRTKVWHATSAPNTGGWLKYGL
jgi:hypothetical protein